MSEYEKPEDLRGEDECEHRKVYIRKRRGDHMANGNGTKNLMDWLRDIIQFAIIPLLYVGWTQINGEISKNADLLRQVQGNQIRVMTTLSTVQSEMLEHEAKSTIESIDRGRVHHTSQRSCVECKMPGRDNYPTRAPRENPFGNK